MSGSTRNLRDGQIIIRDGAPTPNTLVIPIDTGDLAFNIKDPSFVIMNRGKIDSRKQGDETPTDVSFSIKFEQLRYAMGTSGVSVYDALKGKGGASAWVNVDPCAPWSVDIEFRMYNPCNRAQYEQIIFRKFHADSVDFKEGSEANTLSVKGNCLQGEPDITYVQ